MVLYIFAHNLLNIKPIFNRKKKHFGKLRPKALQPCHQMFYMLKHVEGVKGYTL